MSEMVSEAWYAMVDAQRRYTYEWRADHSSLDVLVQIDSDPAARRSK